MVNFKKRKNMNAKHICVVLSFTMITGIIVYSTYSDNPPASPSPQTGGPLTGPQAQALPGGTSQTGAPGASQQGVQPLSPAGGGTTPPGQPGQSPAGANQPNQQPSYPPAGSSIYGAPSSFGGIPGQPGAQSLKPIADIIEDLKNKLSQPNQDVERLIQQHSETIEKAPDKAKIHRELESAKATQEHELIEANRVVKNSFTTDKFDAKNWGEFKVNVKRMYTATLLLEAINALSNKAK